jgi:hypothetical protein
VVEQHPALGARDHLASSGPASGFTEIDVMP